MFPNAQFTKRGPKHEMKQIIKQAIKHEFTDLMIINEDRKALSKFFFFDLAGDNISNPKKKKKVVSKRIHSFVNYFF